MKREINRREFIKEISLAGLGITVGASLVDKIGRKAFAKEKSKIVIASHPEATSDMGINPEIVKNIVDNGLMQYTGQKTIESAWTKILPSLSQNDIVTIKVNCINRSLSTHPELIDAIVAGLISAGIKESNIIIWDRTNRELVNAGYKCNTKDSGVRCFGTDEDGWGYDKEVQVYDKTVKLSKILMKTTHLINAPVLKNHGMSGVTLSMKNHYGSVDNPGSLHGGQCNPYIAMLNEVPEIKHKTRIIILDALLGIFKGGPGGSPQFTYNSVIFGQDPVALDYTGWTIISEESQKNGRELHMPAHIKTANEIGLGTCDPNNIITEKISV